MEPDDLLRRVVEVLERRQLPYLVSASIATIYFGEPRFTNDIDLVVALPIQRVHEFCSEFPPDEFYVSEDAARQAVQSGEQFKIIHPDSALKADIFTPADTPFTRSQFARGHRHHADAPLGFDATFAGPEDVILKKLEYYAEGESEKHLRDITGILKAGQNPVDREYIERWAAELGVLDVWEMILAEMSKPRGPDGLSR